jgi:SAM-dependent methyltransferase
VDYEQIILDLRLAYDRAAKQRAAMEDAPWKQAERERFLVRLRGAGARTLLEIGAGHGVSSRFFQDNGLRVVCTDLSPELVQRSRAAGLHARVMDFRKPDFPDSSFDALFAMNCLLHVPLAELPAVLRSLHAVLRPGGLFYWGQYGGSHFEGNLDSDTYEPRRFFSSLTEDEIKQFASQRFDVIDFKRIGGSRDEPASYHGLILRRSGERPTSPAMA